MDKISCIIVDDEMRARNVLSNLLKSYFPELEIKSTAKNVPEAVDQIKEFNPSVVFLDVQMPNYSGYEIVNFFDEINFEIIFVTAFDNYAIKAFEINAIDYLVKPINRLRLKESIDKLKTRINDSEKIEQYNELLSSIQNNKFEKIILAEQGNKRVLELSSIVAIEASGSYVLFHLDTKQKIMVSKNLKHFENLLSDKSYFFRSHRTWMINLNSVTSYNSSKLEVHHNSSLISHLSRQKLADFKSEFINYEK